MKWTPVLLQYHTVTTLPEQQCGISLCSATSSTSKAYIKEMAELCKNIKEPKALCNNHIRAIEKKKSSMFHNSFFQMEVAVWDHTIKHEMISHSTCPPLGYLKMKPKIIWHFSLTSTGLIYLGGWFWLSSGSETLYQNSCYSTEEISTSINSDSSLEM